MNREYPTLPMIGVGVVVWKEERVLMIRRGKPPRLGEWSLPGGLQELGETVAAAGTREVMEETGVTIGPAVLVDIVDAIYPDEAGRIRSHYTLIDLTARWAAGEPVAGDDALAAEWKTLREIEAMDLWPETRRIILKAREMVRAMG